MPNDDHFHARPGFGYVRTLSQSEELPLLRADHPLLVGALDLLLGSEQGNAAFLIDDVLPVKTVLLQAVFVLESVAAPALHADRFLPPLPLSCIVDTKLAGWGGNGSRRDSASTSSPMALGSSSASNSSCRALRVSLWGPST